MSYSKHFTKRIAVHYSGSVSYPASQSGGSVSYSGTAYEDVSVNITVDTTNFDANVHHCNNTVKTLTGAIIATEGAQIASIKEKANQVGQTIINGFFKTVRSEISQQIMELTNKIDAVLLHLNGLAKRCIDKQHQMETDYQRISERYIKIFEDLNTELENRIYELDKPTFIFRKESDNSSYRMLETDLVNTVTVSGTENSHLEALIRASYVKKNTTDTFSKITSFLEGQKKTANILHNCMLPSNENARYYIPICYLETKSKDEQIDHNIFKPETNETINNNMLINEFGQMTWDKTQENEGEKIKFHFNNELSAQNISPENVHESRVRDYVVQLFNLQNTKNI